MYITILGSCTVIQFPEQIEQFFCNDNLVDVRNGHKMEMDALPLLFLAEFQYQTKLKHRIIHAILANLVQSGGDLWRCGIWGFEETHLRFSAVALRLMLLEQREFEPALITNCFKNHLMHSEKALGGRWFYHDSIETNRQPYYKPWTGGKCVDASAHNMLILNTHIDTLITLLMAKKLASKTLTVDQYIDEGLVALQNFITNTHIVDGFKSAVDSIMRNILLLSMSIKQQTIINKVVTRVVKKLYYNKLRYSVKQRINIRGFTDGFLERDVRLSGESLEYHVVNLWDMSRLLLWMHYTSYEHKSLVTALSTQAINGLKFCYKSSLYTWFIRRISESKGINNEVLEAIAILTVLGYRYEWMGSLYLKYRKFSPPSVAILGIDKTISGGASLQNIHTNNPLIDIIPFENELIFIANHSDQALALNQLFQQEHPAQLYGCSILWASKQQNEDLTPSIAANSIAVVKLNGSTQKGHFS